MISTPGEGSTFTFYLPRNFVPAGATTVPETVPRSRELKGAEAAWTPVESYDSESIELLSSQTPSVLDDRNEIEPGDRTVLIVEDDIPFARILLELA